MPSKSKHFLAMWDVQGLECIFDVDKAKEEIDNWEKGKLFSILKEEISAKKPNPIPLSMMILRARMNSQRQYEIYEFNSTIAMDELKQQFKTNPQPIVDWIRSNGHKVYSDYAGKDNNWVIR